MIILNPARELSVLNVSALSIANINSIAQALESIDAQAIEENGHIYAQLSASLADNSVTTEHTAHDISQAWVEKQATVVKLPHEVITKIAEHSTIVKNIAHRMSHIAAIGKMAYHYCDRQVNQLYEALERLRDAYADEVDPEKRTLLQQDAQHLTEITERNVSTIANTYRKSLTFPYNNQQSFDFHHLAPLWGPTGQPEPEDIEQARFSDCFLLATLGAQAFADPDLVKNSIKEDPEVPGGYVVSLYKLFNGTTTIQHISPEELQTHLHNGKYQYNTGTTPLWPMVAEAAYAKARGAGNIITGDDVIKHGDCLNIAMQNITGKTVSQYASDPILSGTAQIEDQNQILSHIRQALDEHRPVTLGTTNNARLRYQTDSFESNGHTVYRSHAYMVLGVQGDKLLIRNPWGAATNRDAEPTILVNAADMLKNSTQFAIADR